MICVSFHLFISFYQYKVRVFDFTLKLNNNEEAPLPQEAAQPEGDKPPAEGETPTEQPTPEEATTVAEGEQPTEGAPEGQPTVVMPSAEGVQAEGEPAAEGQPLQEGQQEAEQEPAEPTGFEKFKKILTEKDYDIIALPEGVIAPTENKDDVNIPHYSLVEKRKNSGEGVLLYIKDSLRYKVVDLATDNPDEHPSMEQLVAKLELNGLKSPEAEKMAEVIAAVEAPSAETEGTSASAETVAQVLEGVAPTSDKAAPSEGIAPTPEGATVEVPPADSSESAPKQDVPSPPVASVETPAEPLADVTPVPTSPMVEAAA